MASANLKLYLVDESGIIKQELEHMSSENVSTHNNNSNMTNEIDTLRRVLRETCLEVESLREMVHERDGTLRAELETANASLREARAEVKTLRRDFKVQAAKVKRYWVQKCEQLLAHETVVKEKDAEIARLQEQISSHTPTTTRLQEQISSRTPTTTMATGDALSEANVSLPESVAVFQRRGKAPPVDSFKGSDPELRFDDWLPTLERAANWNGWSEDEKLMQLAGYLHGRAACEYSLLFSEEKQSFTTAT